MKIGRRTISLGLSGCMLAGTMLNLGTPATASSFVGYKLPSAASSGTEPGIDIGFDANGDEIVYVHTTHGVPSHNKAFIHQPAMAGYTGPQAFKEVVFPNPYNRLPGGGDADIAFRGDDLWFIDLWLGSNSIQYSPDKGQNWVAGTPFTTLPLSDRQWIALGDTVPHPITASPQTTIYVTYSLIQGGIWFARSRDNGMTWDLHLPVEEAVVGLGQGGNPAHIVSDGSKTVALASRVNMTGGGRYVVAVSRDEGLTWTQHPVSPNADANGSLVGFTMNPDDPDQMAITYATSRLISNKTVVRTTHDGGGTWSDAIRMQPLPVEPDESDEDYETKFAEFDAAYFAMALGPVDWFPWIDWRGDKIAVSWYQSNTTMTGRDPNNGVPGTHHWHIFHAESLDNGATWSLPQQVTTGPAKHGAICDQGLMCNADRDLGDFHQIAIDQHGDSWIATKCTTTCATGAIGGQGQGIYVFKQPS